MSQQNKTTLQAAINTQLADNTSGDISAADIRDNLINMTDSLVFNEGTSQTITGALTVTGGITGSLLGTATTASYVVTAQTASYVLNAISASFSSTASYVLNAISASFSSTASYVLNAQTASYVLNAVSASRAITASYALTAQTLLGSVTSASYAQTASLSNETIGAGNPSNINGGEIQFRGSTGGGGTNGKTTYSSTFVFDAAYGGLTIGDPNTTFQQNGGSYYIQVGTDAVSAGNYSVSFGSSSYANGLGSFTHGKAITANGDYSHAEGLGTIASGSYQHVQGRFNTQGDSTSLLIIGNGTADGSRKDAFKVRMSGSIILPTTQSSAPSWTGTDGEMVFATVTGNHRFYVWMAGAWRSGSLS